MRPCSPVTGQCQSLQCSCDKDLVGGRIVAGVLCHLTQQKAPRAELYMVKAAYVALNQQHRKDFFQSLVQAERAETSSRQVTTKLTVCIQNTDLSSKETILKSNKM